jgi:predicted metal-dependent phosphoesterase TrpH
MVDLHTHSNISDGDFSPVMLIDKAVKQGLSAIALTDHDTIGGLESAKLHAKRQENFRFIPGIEININWGDGKTRGAPGLGPGGEFHLLGLGINKPSPAFIDAVNELSRRRKARNLEIIEKMNEQSMISINNQADVDAFWNELLSTAKGPANTEAYSGANAEDNIHRSLGRPHFAAYLIKHKIVKNVDQAFSRYLGV